MVAKNNFVREAERYHAIEMLRRHLSYTDRLTPEEVNRALTKVSKANLMQMLEDRS